MSQPNVAWDQVKPYLNAFRSLHKLWVYPTAFMTLFAVTYALIMPRTWRANQAILVRAEAIGQHSQGQFDTIDRMKIFQETIFEVARNHTVVASALSRLGPPPGHARGTPWPNQAAIEALQRVVSISAPKGSEPGRTEIFFLSVTGKTPQEAVLRTTTLCDEVEKHLGELRDARARSMVRELEKTLQLAQDDLQEATSRLEAVEREIGPDLGELRTMNEIGSGDSNLRTSLSQIRAEIRKLESDRESLMQLKDLLITATENSNQLLATPSRLLDSQPALRRLKDGLVDAQLKCAELRGRLTDAHATVKSALRSAEQIRNDLNHEVATALKGVEADLVASDAQLAQVSRQYELIQSRLDRLAGLRARYSNLVVDVKHRTEIVDNVKRNLSNAQASSSSAATSSLLTRFHEPVAGDRPVGPGKKSIVAAGAGSGFMLGAGLVFLFMPIGPNGTSRRWNDYVNLGRRTTDRILGRRAGDRATGAAPGGSVATSGVPAKDSSRRRANDPVLPPAAVSGARREQDIRPAPQNPPGGVRQTTSERREVQDRRGQA